MRSSLNSYGEYLFVKCSSICCIVSDSLLLDLFGSTSISSCMTTSFISPNSRGSSRESATSTRSFRSGKEAARKANRWERKEEELPYMVRQRRVFEGVTADCWRRNRTDIACLTALAFNEEPIDCCIRVRSLLAVSCWMFRSKSGSNKRDTGNWAIAGRSIQCCTRYETETHRTWPNSC